MANREWFEARVNLAQHILILGVRLYRWTLSPAQAVLFGPLGRCRFSPSCSTYALEAIQARGALAGSWLGLKRVCRCHPWGGCGHDPVPRLKCEVRSPNSGVPALGDAPSQVTLLGTSKLAAQAD